MGRNYCDSKGAKNPNFKTGLKTKGNPHVGIYNSWQNMKARCLRITHPKYHRYGGRGISIHKEWFDVALFYDWAIKNGWEKGYCIDRIDNDGNYSPENCQWVSVSSNSRKKSTTKITREQANSIRDRASKGESEHDLAGEFGVVHGTVWFIVNNYTHVDSGECAKALKKRDNINKR